MLFKLTNYNCTCICDLILHETLSAWFKFFNENALNSMSPFSLSKGFLVCPNSEIGHPLPTLVVRLYHPGPTRFTSVTKKKQQGQCRES